MELPIIIAVGVFAACIVYAFYFGEVKHGPSQDDNSSSSPPN